MLAGTVWCVFFFLFPAILIAATPSDSFLLRQRRVSLHPRLILSCGQDHCLGEGDADLVPGRLRPSSPAGSAGRARRDQVPLCPRCSQPLPCPGLKAPLVPTLAKAHPDPKLSPVSVRGARRSHAPVRGRGSAGPCRGEQGQPSARVLVFAFCSSSGEDDVLAPPQRLGRWCRVAAGLPRPVGACRLPAAGPAPRRRGCPCARARRRGEQGAGGEGAGPGIHACVRPHARVTPLF